MAGLEIYVDFPEENERISSNIYTFRIGAAPPVSRIDISIDGGPWLACRPASGYWWYDWVGFEIGEHTLKARGFAHDGTIANSKVCRFRRVSA